MPEDSELLGELLERLHAAGGDTDDIEVKAAAGGLSNSLTGSLCGLSNLPEGGWVVLGLDEQVGFAAVQLADPAALKQGLALMGRACEPPVRLKFVDAKSDGLPVVIAEVAATAPSAKPCRVRATGQAWIRSWDGDFVMSSLEEQAFLAQRSHPDFDQRPVQGSGESDLDRELLALWTEAVHAIDPIGLGRFSGDELLFRAGITTSEGQLSVAGLLALGRHPQQYFPRFVINLSAEGDSAAGVRAAETATLTGPIPLMLEGALDWARRTFPRQTLSGDDGSVHEQWQYPLEAFRELISNSLVHRDLDEWSRGEAIEVRLTADALRVTNPGGLYGITVARLGTKGTTSARNARLIELCRYTRSTDGARVVETLASGIPRIFELMHAAGLPVPRFHDNSLRFTAILRSSPRRDERVMDSLNKTQRAVYAALVRGRLSTAELAVQTGLKEPTIRKALRALGDKKLVDRRGGRGQETVYWRSSSS